MFDCTRGRSDGIAVVDGLRAAAQALVLCVGHLRARVGQVAACISEREDSRRGRQVAFFALFLPPGFAVVSGKRQLLLPAAISALIQGCRDG
ncbi:hypothetical protein, partial [Brevibacterium paucivorans]|uniref:hypothetical protein n=1 Tax=Brevibacterium paucivorans TaxID=170994 RepID=UPI002155CFDD